LENKYRPLSCIWLRADADKDGTTQHETWSTARRGAPARRQLVTLWWHGCQRNPVHIRWTDHHFPPVFLITSSSSLQIRKRPNCFSLKKVALEMFRYNSLKAALGLYASLRPTGTGASPPRAPCLRPTSRLNDSKCRHKVCKRHQAGWPLRWADKGTSLTTSIRLWFVKIFRVFEGMARNKF